MNNSRALLLGALLGCASTRTGGAHSENQEATARGIRTNLLRLRVDAERLDASSIEDMQFLANHVALVTRDARAFDRVAEGAGVKVIKTTIRAPNTNPVAERFVGSLRREAVDHVLLLDEEHLGKVAREYVRFFNKARAHQGIQPAHPRGAGERQPRGRIVALPILGGLHHDYRRTT